MPGGLALKVSQQLDVQTHYLSFPIIQWFTFSCPQNTNENSQAGHWRRHRLMPYLLWRISSVPNSWGWSYYLSPSPFPYSPLPIRVASALKLCVNLFLALAYLLSQLSFICLASLPLNLRCCHLPESFCFCGFMPERKSSLVVLVGLERSQESTSSFRTLFLTPSCPNS